FQPPAAAFVSGTLWLAFGTGERTAIGYLGSPNPAAPAAAHDENNRYYVISDPDPPATSPTPPVPGPQPPASGTCPLTFTCAINDISSGGSPGTRGYFFKTADGEKFVTTSVIFAGKVISASFTPSQLKAGDPGFDPCTQRGSGNLYVF